MNPVEAAKKSLEAAEALAEASKKHTKAAKQIILGADPKTWGPALNKVGGPGTYPGMLVGPGGIRKK